MEIDPNEIVTKSYLRAEFEAFEERFELKMDRKLDEKLKEQTEEFKRYVGILAEEFQSRLSAVTEMVVENRGYVLRHEEILEKFVK